MRCFIARDASRLRRFFFSFSRPVISIRMQLVVFWNTLLLIQSINGSVRKFTLSLCSLPIFIYLTHSCSCNIHLYRSQCVEISHHRDRHNGITLYAVNKLIRAINIFFNSRRALKHALMRSINWNATWIIERRRESFWTSFLSQTNSVSSYSTALIHKVSHFAHTKLIPKP